MKRYDLIIVGAGPSGLSAAIEAAKRGLKVIVFDENEKPGGQLFKQIHKFFGSKEHKAKIRGFVIGEQLLKEASEAGVTVRLNATVIGMYMDKEIVVREGEEIHHYKGDSIIIATGAAENMVTFPGWTLPGVIGAGAAQTMMNLHGVKPGNKILMLGSGNVGLVVSFQLMQCGCEVVALVDAAPRVGGYGVHAAKVARTGVPFYLSHTIVEAEGEDCVTGVTIAEVDEKFQFIPGTEKHFVAGDVSGIEEASSAMIEGRIAGVAVYMILNISTVPAERNAIWLLTAITFLILAIYSFFWIKFKMKMPVFKSVPLEKVMAMENDLYYTIRKRRGIWK